MSREVRRVDFESMFCAGRSMIQLGSMYIALAELSCNDSSITKETMLKNIMTCVHNQLQEFEQEYYIVRESDQTMLCIGEKIISVLNHFFEWQDIYEAMNMIEREDGENDTQ